MITIVSLIVAALSSLAALVQSGVLVGQVWTPYRTALYVRQLEVAGDFHAAAHEQWAAIIDLDNECRRRVEAGVDGEADFWRLSERFRKGATEMHNAYSAALATFPSRLHPEAQQIWFINERLVDFILTPSTRCSEFNQNYKDKDGRDRADAMNAAAGDLVEDMRLLLRVDRWSRQDLERAQLRGAAEPVMKYARRKLPSSLFE